jgi:hypothetical protein
MKRTMRRRRLSSGSVPSSEITVASSARSPRSSGRRLPPELFFGPESPVEEVVADAELLVQLADRGPVVAAGGEGAQGGEENLVAAPMPEEP